jgi:hypothetical protein
VLPSPYRILSSVTYTKNKDLIHPNIISSFVLYRHEIWFLTMRKEQSEGMLKAGCIREYMERERK